MGAESWPSNFKPVVVGRYTFQVAEGGWAIDVLRHGEPWLTIEDGHKAVMSLMSELREDRSLVEQALRNASLRPGRKPLWAHVADVFGIGSTRASDLCRRFNINSDQAVGVNDKGQSTALAEESCD